MKYDQQENFASPDNSEDKNTRREYDPFARNAHSESEFQKEERKEIETNPGKTENIPGSPIVTGGNVEPNIPGGPEIKPAHNPERPVNPQPERPFNPQPEIKPDHNSPEIQIPFEPVRRNDPHDFDDMHIKGHMESAWQDAEDDGELKRIYPSIQNHDNLEGISDTSGENWDGENKDLDIDGDSNREE